ncbi:MAG: hypothetical protein II777_09135 [Clostridia bacterium]|nr:hypothetical protein [Clostridia bacterium]
MKKVLAILIVAAMAISLMGVAVSAEGETLKIFLGDAEATADVVPGGGMTVEQSGTGVIATNAGSGDPWISVEFAEGVDMSVYKFFTVTYRCDSEIGSNNTYMKTSGYIGAVDGGDWESHGMGGTADGEWHSVEYSMEGTDASNPGRNGFPTFTDQVIYGIRLTCCGTEGGKVEFASIRFTAEHYEEPQQEQPDEPSPTSDAAIVAIAAVGCIALAGAVVAKKVK